MLRLSIGRAILVPPLCACLACYETPFYPFCCYQVHSISSKWLSLSVVDRTKFKLQHEIILLKHMQTVKHQTLHSHTLHSFPFFTLFVWSWPNHHKNNVKFNYLLVFSNLCLPKVELLLCNPDSGNLCDVKFTFGFGKSKDTSVVKDEHLCIYTFLNLVWHSLATGSHIHTLIPLHLGTCNHLFSPKLTISTHH